MNWLKEQSLEDQEIQNNLLATCKIPKHIGIIMDGNGRWALERGLSRTEGHKQGIESVRDIVKASAQLKIGYLTLYAFSIENWNRPLTEVGILMKLLEHYLKSEIDEIDENNIRLYSIGKLSSLPKKVQRLLFEAVERTAKNTGLTLTLALSYSGRWDIVRAVQMLVHDVRRSKLAPEDITEETFSSYLQTNILPDPDLIIRTSGEMRLSNFLLWESAYSEIYISNKYWPEFRRTDLYEAIIDYSRRERRFGRTSEQVVSQSKTIEFQSEKSLNTR
ncbi:MAG: isoprenyl transferase [Ignavibacteria bacterium]|nr:isoprenyl transferase [Ignavibacteria bacterium]